MSRYHLDTDFLVFAIGVTAAACDALLMTRNARDFAGIPGLTVQAG